MSFCPVKIRWWLPVPTAKPRPPACLPGFTKWLLVLNPRWHRLFSLAALPRISVTSFRVRDGKPFILEGDEYDTAFFDKGPKFMHYFPDALILTHVEFDHADIYDDLAAVKTAFRRLVNLVPRRGRVIAYDGSANVDACVVRAFCAVERYGFKPESAWQITDLTHDNRTSSWNIVRSGKPWLQVSLPMPGEHNALNATAAVALAAGQGIDGSAIVEALATFHSVKRRLEVRAVADGVTIIDDFAHHPTAIRETLKALRAA